MRLMHFYIFNFPFRFLFFIFEENLISSSLLISNKCFAITRLTHNICPKEIVFTFEIKKIHRTLFTCLNESSSLLITVYCNTGEEHLIVKTLIFRDIYCWFLAKGNLKINY